MAFDEMTAKPTRTSVTLAGVPIMLGAKQKSLYAHISGTMSAACVQDIIWALVPWLVR